jgi:uncharacterized membrane protein
MDQKVVDEGKPLAWLSYLGIFLLIPLLAQKDNEYSKFHVKQGIVFLICCIIFSVAGFILLWIPILGMIIFSGIQLALLILFIMGLINSLTGKTDPLPVIGKYAEKIKI